MEINAKIGEIRLAFLEDFKKIRNSKDLEQLKIRYLGKKGLLQEVMVSLKNCSNKERPTFGKLLNDLKKEIISHYENSLQRLKKEEQDKQLQKEKIDVTLPGKKQFLGRKHPTMQMMDKIIDILSQMSFSVQYGPDLETDYYNFEALNFDKEHPARDMQDTFYFSSDFLLRTHTSNVQIRVMEKNKPPIRVIAPGRCFRNETISSRSHVMFHQVEAFYIDKNVTFGDLMATMEQFFSSLLGEKVKTRFRPSYFPFVEPGMEVDIYCSACKGEGCSLCKQSGWLEVCGAGMIHPKVLKAGGIDPEIYSGYAWGLGIERLAMLHYGIKDVRMFTQNDMRFLEQFPAL